MPRVHIPPLLRTVTEGRAEVTVPGSSVSEVIDALEEHFPGIRERVTSAGRLKPGLNVSIDGQLCTMGMWEKVGPDSEVHLLSAFGGG